MLDEAFVNELPVDALDAALMVVERFDKWHKQHARNGFDKSLYGLAVEFIEVLHLIAERDKEVPAPPIPSLDGTVQQNMNTITAIVEAYEKILRLAHTKRLTLQAKERAKSRFGPLMGGGDMIGFRFTDGDLETIQTRLNELRQLISGCEALSATHRQRLLRRLEKLQSEFHKAMSDVDRFLGFVSEVGSVLGEFGEDVRPVVERIQEVAEIIRNAATTPMAALMEPVAQALAAGREFRQLEAGRQRIDSKGEIVVSDRVEVKT